MAGWASPPRQTQAKRKYFHVMTIDCYARRDDSYRIACIESFNAFYASLDHGRVRRKPRVVHRRSAKSNSDSWVHEPCIKGNCAQDPSQIETRVHASV